jgi:hypothetical protein
MTTILLVALASLAVYSAVSRRHQCAHKNPLCRRQRPCLLCYRELFDSVGFTGRVVGQASGLPRGTSRRLVLLRWRKL